MDTNFDLNDIMNPGANLPFLRKLLLSFVSKLSVDGERNRGNIKNTGQNSEGE
jgi:hypothetical protein